MSSELLTDEELRARVERMKAPPRLRFAKTTELLALASDGDGSGGPPPIIDDQVPTGSRRAPPPRPEGSGGFDASQGAVFGELRAIPDALLPVPPWQDDLLPESLRPWTSDVSERMQAAPEFNAVGVLATLGSVIGRQVVVLPKRFDNWAVVPHPWAAVIGAPALMKSPALRESLAFLRRLEIGARKEFEQKIAEHLATSEVAKARREAIKDRIKKAAKEANDDELKTLQAELAKLPADPGKPPERRYMVNDATVEKLGEVLAENPFGVLTFRDELAGWLRQLDREGREGERTFYLECWDGLSGFTFDRITRGTVRIEPACLTVLGGIQPGPLGEYLRAAVRGGAGDDGLVQRFQLAVYPDVPPHWRNIDRPPDEAAARKVDELFRACSKLDPIAIGAMEWSHGLRAFHFSPEAQNIFDEWRARLEIRLRSGEEAPIFMAHLGKYKSLVPALATIFHVADVVTGVTAPGPISAAAVDLAIRWAIFLEQHARRIYGLALARGEAAAKALSKKLLTRALPIPFSAREVYHRGWAGLTDPEEVREGLELLEDLGWVASEPGTKSAKGGRPSLRYFPNPAIWGFKPAAPVTRNDLKQPPPGTAETAKTPGASPEYPPTGAAKTDTTGSGGFGSPQGDESGTKISDDGFEEELL